MEIRALIERCLAKEPGQRPAAEHLLAQLGDIDFADQARRGTAWDLAPRDRSVTGEVPRISVAPTVTHPVPPASGRPRALRPALTATLAHGGSQGVNGVAFGPDGGLLAAADGNGRTYLWDVASGRLAGTLADSRSRDVYAVAFGPWGDVLATADGNGRTYLWDVASGELAATLAGPDSLGVNGVAFGPRGDVLAAADCNGCVYLWQVRR